MFTVLVAGLPISANSILSEAMNQAFGEGVVSIEEIPREKLRSRVRLSGRNVNDILVVLDEVCTGLCKDIENGLYSSEKFHTYTSDLEFVSFLNTKYGISLVAEEETEVGETCIVPDNTLEEYKSTINYKERVISNLRGQILEYEERIKDFLPKEAEVDDGLAEEVLLLRDKLLDAENELERKNDELLELEKRVEVLSEKSDSSENKRKSLLSSYNSISAELTDLKVVYSKQSGVLKDKDNKIKELSSSLESKSKDISSLHSLKRELEEERSVSESLLNEKSKLESLLRDKESDILRYLQELESLRKNGKSEEVIDSLKRDLEKLREDKQELKEKVVVLESENNQLQSQLDAGFNGVEDLEQRLEEYQKRIEEDSNTVAILNKEKLELKARLEVLEASTDKNSNLQAVMEEMIEYRDKYTVLTKGVFGKISSLSLPKSSLAVKLTRGGVSLSNVRFAFAGSSESRKGAYRCLLNEFRSSNERHIIADLVSETSVDYVFEIQKMVSGLNWFSSGGGVQQYLSKTCLNNVWVLSPGLAYVNDAYFLTINWERRLTELEKSGYKVTVFCGDISSLVGRVLHESFADLGRSIVYVHGNAVGSRTVITNLRGITNSEKSEIMYFEFNSMLSKFYDIVAKTNKCTILGND